MAATKNLFYSAWRFDPIADFYFFLIFHPFTDSLIRGILALTPQTRENPAYTVGLAELGNGAIQTRGRRQSFYSPGLIKFAVLVNWRLSKAQRTVRGGVMVWTLNEWDHPIRRQRYVKDLIILFNGPNVL